MRLLPHFVFAVAILAGLGGADAHPGHITDDGHGHNHWLAVIILGGLGALAAGGLLYRLVTGRLPFFDARRASH